MDSAAIRTKLHEYIERADDRHLEAMYVLLESKPVTAYEYDEDTLQMVSERREEYLRGTSETLTAVESLAKVRDGKR